MAIVNSKRVWHRLVGGCAAVMAAGLIAPGLAQAQGELGTIPFRSTPYTVVGNTTQGLTLVGARPGPKGPGSLWNFAQFGSGGHANGPFMRYYWWDWDVSRVGHDADQAGWTGDGSVLRPAGGWSQFGQGPFYLRFRMRVAAPLLEVRGQSACDDSQMKWFIWNNFTPEGTDRVILMFHSGAQIGGNEMTQTTLQLRAGVSGSWAATLMPNSQWVHVQVGWRWGPESSGFQRIWVNNNSYGSPNAHNNRFDDLDVWGRTDHWGNPNGPQNLDEQFFFGDIANTGSCVREDAIIDIADVEFATQFDTGWFPGASSTVDAPRNLRIVPGDVGAAALPFGVCGLVLAMRRLRRRME